MALQGSFETFPLTDIFQLLGMQQKTGVLTITHGSRVSRIHFFRGCVTQATENRVETEHMLGKILVKSGLITPDTLMDALNVQRRENRKLGEILVEKGSIDSQILKNLLQTQMTQVVYKLFNLNKGAYSFDPTADVVVDEDSFPPIPADHLLLEGVRLVDEWPVILRTISSMNMVFRLKRNVSKETAFTLAPQERQVFEHVNGRNSVQEIIYKTLLSEFDVCKALYNMLQEGVIEEDVQAAKKNIFNVDFVNPFLQATTETIETMCGIPVAAGKPRLKKPLELARGDVSGVIDLNGEKRGVFAITFTKQCVLSVVSKMLGAKSTYIDTQVRDAVGELTNIIAGGGRRKLADRGFIFSASIPAVITGERHYVEHKTDGPCIMIPFTTTFGPFTTEVSLQR